MTDDMFAALTSRRGSAPSIAETEDHSAVDEKPKGAAQLATCTGVTTGEREALLRGILAVMATAAIDMELRDQQKVPRLLSV